MVKVINKKSGEFLGLETNLGTLSSRWVKWTW